MLSRAPTVLLIITPLCRRIVSKALRKRTFKPLTQSTCKNAFHSLRQYLECDFFFGYAPRVLLYFRLYCSLANEVLLKFAIHILLTRISQNMNLLFSFLIPNFAFLIKNMSCEPTFASKRSLTRADIISIKLRIISGTKVLAKLAQGISSTDQIRDLGCHLSFKKREFVHLRLWCTNGAPIGQIKFSYYSNKAKCQIDVPRMSI